MSESTGTELIVAANIVPAQVFADGVDGLIAEIEAKAKAHQPDTSTAKGRKEIASIANKVARSKTLLDGMGKDLNEDKRRQIAVVDAERRKIRDKLDALKDEVRRPLTEWEQAEADRVEKIRDRLEALDAGRADMHCPVEQIERVIAEIEATPIDDTWQEFSAEAAKRKDAALTSLRADLEAARKRESEQAELARLRAEAEERERKTREEEQAKAAKEAEARAEKEAQERQRREAEQRAQWEAESKAAAEKAAKDAEERERKRAADEKARQEAEAAKRAADQQHRGKVNREAAAAIEATGVTADQARAVVIAIVNGDVPHITIRY